MASISRGIKYLLTNRTQFLDSIVKNYFSFLPDKIYLSLRFRLKMGKWINWKNPLTYNEKLQWLKVYNRRKEYSRLVDKYEVKEYVRSIIGDEYVIPTLGVWDNAEDIDITSLPDQFVLKTTHSGGNTGVVICKDKSNFDLEAARQKLRVSLSQSIYKGLREWPYKDVKPRIMAEVYMSDNIHDTLLDYKFYCFDGEPKVLVIATGRNENLCFDYFDMNFNHLPFEQGGPNSQNSIAKPQNMEKMIELAATLSKGMPHVRMDFYEVNSQVYFGEYTFFDSSGMAKFNPVEWDYIFGGYIVLPK